MKILKYILIVIFSVVICAEIILRVKGVNKTYSELIGQGYYTDYGKVEPTWYHNWVTRGNFVPQNTDFHYDYFINQTGVRDKDFTAQKPDSTLRILVTGDSFAEGVGAPYDSTWPRILERLLREKHIAVEVMDAGVSGSDILYDYVFYRDKLAAFHPDIVLASMNTSDYSDFMFRGGIERFRRDGTTHFKRGPWFGLLYHYSYFFRALLHSLNKYPYTGIFISQEHFIDAMNSVNLQMLDAFKDYRHCAESNHAKFVAVLHPGPSEILYKNTINDAYKLMLARLSDSLNVAGIRYYSLSAGLHKNFDGKPWQEFTYLHDKHFRPAGYNVFANLVADSLLTYGNLFPDTKIVTTH
jgi:lysophospholipase L1-like esterase